MVKYVLVSDTTLTASYRHFPLLSFLPCAPSSKIPKSVYKFLKGPQVGALENGEIKAAPYALRKVEAALLKENKREDVVVAHPDYLDRFIKEDTEVIGVTTMDPLGIGPTTMSYYALFGGTLDAWVTRDWIELINKINALRKGKKAKLLVGGPGVWEFTILRDEVEKEGIDYLYQGEADDIIPELFREVAEGSIDENLFFKGYFSYDEKMRRYYKKDEKFLSKGLMQRTYPRLEEIPAIVRPSMEGLVEVMRGCGIGCDFCEVTLRPLRYYPFETIKKEVLVNVSMGGYSNAWVHSDEIFGYMHGPNFVPNEEALVDLFSGLMSIPGVKRSNPTHGRISIPAGYPELIEKLSKVLRAGPGNWIGIQTGIETGSERLAKIHMPNKTLPLRIGPDGSWMEIVWQGVYVETKNFWRPAFTVQVGQSEETPEDNWDTIALINQLSNSYAGNIPFEFTVTPLLNVPLGMLRARKIDNTILRDDQIAVYYAAYRHLAKMARRDAFKDAKGNPMLKYSVGSIIALGGDLMLRIIANIARKRGVDLEKVKEWGLKGKKEITSVQMVE
ncbi:MAG: radical SAM protein [Candidatus Micrarchaeaceae archaeon]